LSFWNDIDTFLCFILSGIISISCNSSSDDRVTDMYILSLATSEMRYARPPKSDYQNLLMVVGVRRNLSAWWFPRRFELTKRALSNCDSFDTTLSKASVLKKEYISNLKYFDLIVIDSYYVNSSWLIIFGWSGIQIWKCTCLSLFLKNYSIRLPLFGCLNPFYLWKVLSTTHPDEISSLSDCF